MCESSRFCHSGKTATLLDHAFSCASQGRTVLYVSPLGMNQLPQLDRQVQQTPSVLKSIQFV